MTIVALKRRKYLSADALYGVVRSGFVTIPDSHLSDTDITLTDALISASALVSLTSPSRPADKERVAGNWEIICSLERVPCDTHMRAQNGSITYDERHDNTAGVVHRFRLVNDMPLNA